MSEGYSELDQENLVN